MLAVELEATPPRARAGIFPPSGGLTRRTVRDSRRVLSRAVRTTDVSFFAPWRSKGRSHVPSISRSPARRFCSRRGRTVGGRGPAARPQQRPTGRPLGNGARDADRREPDRGRRSLRRSRPRRGPDRALPPLVRVHRKPSQKIFAAAWSSECSTFEQPPFFGGDEAELRACARAADAGLAVTLTVDGTPMPLSEVESDLLRIHLPEDNIFGASDRKGLSVALGWVSYLGRLSPGTHELVIHVGGTLFGDPIDFTNTTTSSSPSGKRCRHRRVDAAYRTGMPRAPPRARRVALGRLAAPGLPQSRLGRPRQPTCRA